MTNGNIKYGHTNLIARDWKKLSQFYIKVFNCEPTDPERDLAGEWADRLTGIDHVRIRGIHLRLPGYENGPTLEIFGYEPGNFSESAAQINHQGWGHIAFLVDSVTDVLAQVLANGGSRLGETITQEYPGVGVLTAVYARDPEGNAIEIQNWS